MSKPSTRSPQSSESGHIGKTSESTLSFRPATLDDLPTLLAFEQGVIRAERPFNAIIRTPELDENKAPVHYYDIKALIQRDSSLLLIGELTKELTDELIETDARKKKQAKAICCGYIDLRQSKPQHRHLQHGYIGFIYVEPEYRGQGFSQGLIQALTAWGKQHGVSDFYLDVYAENHSAIRAYEKLGFKPGLVEMKLHE